MKPTNEEVYQALITMQNLCSEIENCINCPLHMESFEICGLTRADMPEDWEINGVSKWKAFGQKGRSYVTM